MNQNKMITGPSDLALGCVAAGYIVLKLATIYKGIDGTQLDLIFLCGLLGSEVYRFKSSLSERTFYENTGRGIIVAGLIIMFISKLQNFFTQ